MVSRSRKFLPLLVSVVAVGTPWLASYFTMIVVVLGGAEFRLAGGGVSVGPDAKGTLVDAYIADAIDPTRHRGGTREWREANELLGFSTGPEGSRVPLWFLVAAVCVVHRGTGLVLARLGEWSHHRHARRHLVCRACGYDLRATPLRCPECGREAELLPSLPPAPRRPTPRAASATAE